MLSTIPSQLSYSPLTPVTNRPLLLVPTNWVLNCVPELFKAEANKKCAQVTRYPPVIWSTNPYHAPPGPLKMSNVKTLYTRIYDLRAKRWPSKRRTSKTWSKIKRHIFRAAFPCLCERKFSICRRRIWQKEMNCDLGIRSTGVMNYFEFELFFTTSKYTVECVNRFFFIQCKYMG